MEGQQQVPALGEAAQGRQTGMQVADLTHAWSGGREGQGRGPGQQRRHVSMATRRVASDAMLHGVHLECSAWWGCLCVCACVRACVQVLVCACECVFARVLWGWEAAQAWNQA